MASKRGRDSNREVDDVGSSGGAGHHLVQELQQGIEVWGGIGDGGPTRENQGWPRRGSGWGRRSWQQSHLLGQVKEIGGGLPVRQKRRQCGEKHPKVSLEKRGRSQVGGLSALDARLDRRGVHQRIRPSQGQESRVQEQGSESSRHARQVYQSGTEPSGEAGALGEEKAHMGREGRGEGVVAKTRARARVRIPQILELVHNSLGPLTQRKYLMHTTPKKTMLCGEGGARGPGPGLGAIWFPTEETVSRVPLELRHGNSRMGRWRER
jgi:hypothetical protein